MTGVSLCMASRVRIARLGEEEGGGRNVMHTLEVVVPCPGFNFRAFDDAWWVKAGGNGAPGVRGLQRGWELSWSQ